MSPSGAVLERECRTFTRYLTGRGPTPYVVQKYREAHAASTAFDADRFDSRLTAVARWHPVTTLLADAYARFFVPYGTLRKKLILLLAILEISPPFFRELNYPSAGGRLGQALYLGARMFMLVLALVVGTIAFLPMHLVTPRGNGGRQ